MGKSLMYESRKLLLFCMLFYVAIARAEGLGDTSPIGILSNSNDEYIIKKSPDWQLEAIDHATYLSLLQPKPANNCPFNTSTIDAIKACNSKGLCNPALGLNALSFNGDTCVSEMENYSLTFQKLTPDFYLVEPFSLGGGILIDANTNKMMSFAKMNLVAVDAKNNQILYAKCNDKLKISECEIFESNIQGKDVHSIINLKYIIHDLFIRNGVLYVLASKPNTKFHMRSLLMNWSGHGAYYSDFFMLELAISDKKVSEFPLVKNMLNASGRFSNKWESKTVK